ncbi:t-SNARE [Cokeromyces recurvatus]|uniref:t-SNARE n=1 Tax=Cokeromyces recurvatus TaxID=90255 RepID=UPI0022203510|nr:t-SNARE [Cokeromyces recurvatus]KAI7901827.1 t-SNARE [Cokeromyces recurvatus]
MSFNDLEQGLNITNTLHNTSLSITELTQRIAQQIFHINGNISSIERLVNFLGTPKDTIEIRGKLHDVTNATRDLVKLSTQDLKSLSSFQIQDPKKNRQRRLEQQKLSKDFQKVVSNFQNVQRNSASRQREYVDKAKATTVMLQSQAEATEDSEEQDTMLIHSQRQAQLEALDNEIEYNELLINERESEIQNIEQGITELNEIFRDMGMLVNEQESGIQSIYGNVLNIAQNTRQAADELVVANRYQKKSRRTMCCFLLIITIVGCILSLIIVIAK